MERVPARHENRLDSYRELIHAHRACGRLKFASLLISLAVLFLYFYDGQLLHGVAVGRSVLALLVLSRFLHASDDLREEVLPAAIVVSTPVEGPEVLSKVGCEVFIRPETTRTKRLEHRVLPAEHVSEKHFKRILSLLLLLLLGSSLSLTLSLSFFPGLSFSPSLLLGKRAEIPASEDRLHRRVHRETWSKNKLQGIGLVSLPLLVGPFPILARL